MTAYLIQIEDDVDVSFAQIRDELLFRIETALSLANPARKGAGLLPFVPPRQLDELSIARVLLARRHIVAVDLAGRGDPDLTMLALYMEEGPSRGLYVNDQTAIHRLVSEVRPSMTGSAVDSFMKSLKAQAPMLPRTTAAHLIPVNNGVFDHERQELQEFSPEHVFLAKSPVDYDPHAENPVIEMPDGQDWDVEGWIGSLSDDEGVPELLWEIASAIVRPGVRWNKAAFFHSSKGNNGKGTFCALLRNLVGPKGSASIPLANFGKGFALAELVHARAIIVDENSVGAFAKDLGDFKAVVTGDAFTLDRKYKDPLSITFSGMVVQCVNDFPKSRDKSASYARRQLFVPFRKWFGGGDERKYIKDDYLRRPDVLRYVLRRAVEMQHSALSEPQACKDLLDQFQRENNPVKDFWMEHEAEFVWDLLPTSFLYELFVAWFRKTHPSGTPVNRNDFASLLVEVLAEHPDWLYKDPQRKHRPGTRMQEAEPLIIDYDLKSWMNASYTGTDPGKRAHPLPLKANYIGVLRTSPRPAAGSAGSAGPDPDADFDVDPDLDGADTGSAEDGGAA